MTGPSAYCGALWLAALRAPIEIGRAGRGWARRDGRRRRGTLRELARDGDGGVRVRGCGPATHYRLRRRRRRVAPTAIMADQLAGQWYADATGLGDARRPRLASSGRCGRSTR